MRLTTFSDYTLRVLAYLGPHDEAFVTIEDICSPQKFHPGESTAADTSYDMMSAWSC